MAASNVEPAVRSNAKTCVKITKLHFERQPSAERGAMERTLHALENMSLNFRPAYGFVCAAKEIGLTSPHGFDIICEGEAAKRHLSRYDRKSAVAFETPFTLPNGLSVKAATIVSPRIEKADLAASLQTKSIGRIEVEQHINLRQFLAETNSRAGRTAMIDALMGLARAVSHRSNVIITGEEQKYPRLRVMFERIDTNRLQPRPRRYPTVNV